jgi:uncharacterized protein (TIRG00374 family)
VQDVDLYLLGIAIVLNLPMVLLKTLRWKNLMYRQDIRYPIGKAYLAYFGGIFIGFFTPGRLGEFIKAIHINQDCRVSVGRALSSVLADRLFDLYALLLVGGVALTTLALSVNGVITVIASALLLVMPLGLFLHNTTFDWLRKISQRLGYWGRKLVEPDNWLSELRQGLRQLSWMGVLVAVALTILAYSVFFGQCYLLALALRIPVGVVPICYAVALGSLVTLLPISIAGLGTRETTIIMYLDTAGVRAEAALSFSLLVFLTFYVAGGLMGAVAWWLKPAPLLGDGTSAVSLMHSAGDR